MGVLRPFPFRGVRKPQVSAIIPAQELSLGSTVISRRISLDIFQGKNESMSDGTRPPFSAQLSRNHVSQARMLILERAKVANSEKSVAANRPLHCDPEP